MFTWLYENLATIIISLLLAGAVAGIIVSMIVKKKKGKPPCDCGCGCTGCSGCCGCGSGGTKDRSNDLMEPHKEFKI